MTIHLEKKYGHPNGDIITVDGSIELPKAQVAHFRKQLSKRQIQPFDPRIAWSDDFDELYEQGFEYISFSFREM